MQLGLVATILVLAVSQLHALRPQQASGAEPAEPDRAHRPADHPIFRYSGSALNSSTVRLVWHLKNNAHADHFDVKWGPIPDVDVFAVNQLNGSAREYFFHGLQAKTHYQFELRGYLADRPLRPLLVDVWTKPANYVAASPADHNQAVMPLAVKAEPKSNSSILLSWVEPERPAAYQNSARVNTVRYYLTPNASSLEPPQYLYRNVSGARDSRLAISNLRPAAEYAFAVKTAYFSPDMKRLFTQSGFSMDTLARTLDLEPSAPRNFSFQELPATKDELAAGRQSIELSWQPPESPNGELKGYLILFAHDLLAPDDKWRRIPVDGAQTYNWQLAKFNPGANYYLKIRAVNQRGPGADSETRLYAAPSQAPPALTMSPNSPLPLNNVFLLIVICMVAFLFLLFVLVSHLACKSRRKPRKGSLASAGQKSSSQSAGELLTGSSASAPKLNAFASTNSSTVAARVGTLARRRDNNPQAKPDFWISALDQHQEVKSNISEKSNQDLNMAMVSIQRHSPQFATTHIAPNLPDYRPQFSNPSQQAELMQQLNRSHYHPGLQLGYDQMDSATASALMTLSKRQQQQMQKYQFQFQSTPPVSAPSGGPLQAPSPHQQPPPPPPLNIEQQQQQQQHHHQSLYGSHLATTRSLRLHRPAVYDPLSESFIQTATSEAGPPNYNSHTHMATHQPNTFNLATSQPPTSMSSTLQFHPHQTSTLLSRRSTNTLRSFQNQNSPGTIYGQVASNNLSQFGSQQPQVLLQSHQAVINQLNNSTYPSLPLKHVSAVRPQIMSSLEDQIELELAEKDPHHQQLQQQHHHHQQQQQQQQLQQSNILAEHQTEANPIKQQ